MKFIDNLTKKESLRLRLLAEEMVALLTGLVEKFEGDYDNVVGLPIKEIDDAIKEFLKWEITL